MSPVTALSSIPSSSSDALKDLSRATASSAPAAVMVPQAAATPTVATPPAAESGTKSANDAAGTDNYTVRTSFDAATGEWALVVERHPPEVGVIVAEQKGFVSQYSAMANSPMNLSSGYIARV